MSTTMQAANLHGPGDLRVESIPRPIPKEGEVVVKVRCCGICGSDVPRITTTGTYHFPTVPGHEFGGVVDEVPAGIDAPAPGTRVAVIPLIPCRSCAMCEIGNYAQCTGYDFLGSRSDGGFAEYVRVPAANLVVVPDDVSDAAAAMLEPTATTLHAVRNVGVPWGAVVVVYGLGAIGNLTAQWARTFGARRVFAVDIIAEKVEVARRCGLTDATVASSDELAALVSDATGGRGADVVFDASGSEAALTQGIVLLRHFGRLGLIGRPGKPVSLSDAAFERILRYQLSLVGNWSFDFTAFPSHSWVDGLLAIKSGKILADPLITHRVRLDRIHEGLQLMAERRPDVCKVIVEP